MINDQTVDSHADLLKVVDNLLFEAGVDCLELGGKLTFAGLDPIRPTVHIASGLARSSSRYFSAGGWSNATVSLSPE